MWTQETLLLTQLRQTTAQFSIALELSPFVAEQAAGSQGCPLAPQPPLSSLKTFQFDWVTQAPGRLAEDKLG